MAERNIPLQVFHFDCFWMQEFRWCDFVWDKRMFPDAKGFIQRLKARGLQICVWVNPYIGQQGAIFDEAVEKGYLVMKKNGDVFQTDMWQPGMGIVDFTNPEACKWYSDKIRALCEMGVDAINSQLWCMGVEKVAEQFAGKITFWGEISRQTILPHGTPQDIRNAAQTMIRLLHVNGGGLIGQSEMNWDVPLENVEAFYQAWDQQA